MMGEALIERLEAASVPDRELDLAIWRLVDPNAAEIEAAGKQPLRWLHCYTASLDAAMTLVPKGWNWMAGNRDQPVARAYVNNGKSHSIGVGSRKNPDLVWHEAVAATPALALCIAALRAQSQEGK